MTTNELAVKEQRRRRRSAAKGKRECDAWNAAYPVGQLVTLTKDDGGWSVTRTRSEAWCLGDGTPVVMVVGRAGGYLLSRIKAREIE